MRAVTVRKELVREGPGSYSMAVFFVFICAALLSLLYFEGGDFQALPEGRCLLGCASVLLLLTAAYSGSIYGRACLPVATALMGILCACAFCLVAQGLKYRETDSLYLLPVLLLAAPLQFVMSAAGMKNSAMLHRVMCQSASSYGSELRSQNIMMLLSAVASAGLAVYIFFR